MSNPPVYSESMNSVANRMVGALSRSTIDRPVADVELELGKPGRTLSLYPGRMGYDLQQELQFLTNRAMEPNIFFAAGFLAPAMPRLDERQVRLVLIRDEDEKRSRMRLAMPFAVEKPGFSVGPSIIRTWSHPFGPLGTPLVDAEGAAETIEHMLDGLSRPAANLPGVMVLPDLRLDGAFTQMIRALAISLDMPLSVISRVKRPMLASEVDGDDYLVQSISKEHRRELRRQRRQLEKHGALSYQVVRQPAEVLDRLEEFLALEASGWKGRKRTAMVMDRYRAAFVREAVSNLAETDSVRIHALDLNGEAIASMVVFVMGGEAYTWKTAYDERFARFSPGKLLMEELTRWNLDDANIDRTDSCAVPDHPIMSRFWREREDIGTLVIGLRRNSDRDVRQVSSQLHLYRNTRNVARILRDKILSRRSRSNES